MISAIAAIFVIFSVFILLTGVLSSSVALMGADNMSESCTGVVKEVIPHFSYGTDGEPRTWLSYEIDMRMDGKEEKVSVWAPEWYGAKRTGTEITVAYDPDNPQRCILTDVKDTFEQVLPIFVKSSVILATIGAILAIISVTTGM